MICHSARESMKLQYRFQSSHYILEEKIIIYFVSMLVEYIVWLLFGSICGGEKQV